MKRFYQLAIVGFPLFVAGCGGGGSDGAASTGASIRGTVPGTTIEALGDNGSYYVVQSHNDGTQRHPFKLQLPSSLGFHLVMITGQGTPDEVVIPIGYRDSANNVRTRFMLGKGDAVDLGYIPLPMGRYAAAAHDLDSDGVFDMPLLLDDVGAKNPLKQTHVNQKGISDWDDSKNGGYHYDTNTIDPQDVNGDGIPNLYDRRYVRRENDSDGDGLPNNVDANPYNDSKHGNHDISDDHDGDGYSDKDRNHDGFCDDDRDRDGYCDEPPAPTPTPTPTPTTGEALYNSNCAGCHDGEALAGGGRQVLGARECTIKSAIYGTSAFPDGVPTMQFLKGLLSDAEIRQIADFLNQGTVTGQQRYITACAGCHGIDARGGPTGEGVLGENGSEIREYIYEERDMRFLSCLPRSDTDAMSIYLTGKEPPTPTPTNQPPTANPNGPYGGAVGSPVSFSGSGSADTDGTIVTYAWNFGDGTTGSGVSPTHTYASAGTFTVTLTVTDDGGATATATTSASIGLSTNQPPTANPNGPYSALANQAILFDATGSADPDGTIVQYDWNFGDGTVMANAGPQPTHTYTTDGTFTVTLTVTDDGGATATATTSANIGASTPPPPLDTLTPSCGSACHGLPPVIVTGGFGGGAATNMPHTASNTCGTCHVIGGWVPGTTTFDMTNVASHNNGTLDIRSDLPTPSCGACHGLPPPPNPAQGLPTVSSPAGYSITGTHPSGKSYMSSCGACHPVGPGSPFTTMPATHTATGGGGGVLNFNP